MPRATDRAARNGHGSAVVWLTGLSAAGKSTIARAVEDALSARLVQVYGLDGDELRRGLCRDLGFSPRDRAENLRRAGAVAALFADAGMVVVASFISPYRRERESARTVAAPAPFVEVFVDCPLEECARRDPKGLYARARAGELADLTGVSAPYEMPEAPDIHLRTDQTPVSVSVAQIVGHLEGIGVLPR
jgi:adenylyl-sulfate kinase